MGVMLNTFLNVYDLIMVARLGIEPRLTGSESVVLPLDDLAIFILKF